MAGVVASKTENSAKTVSRLRAPLPGNVMPGASVGRFPPRQRKTPGSFLPGVLLEEFRRSRSEVTLSANVEGHGALVLELIHGVRLRRIVGQCRSTGELLIQQE